MSDSGLHLAKIPLRTEKLVQVARRRGILIRQLDDGYLAHCVLRELWQQDAPTPFVLRGRGRYLDVWGYTKADAQTLIDHAQGFGDPALLAVIDDLDGIATKSIVSFSPGKRVGFHLRACPVVRLSSARGSFRAGAEIDAFLAKCLRVGADVAVSRDEVYRNWLQTRFADPTRSGIRVERVAVAGFSRERFTRRTHGVERKPGRLERPDVRFEGELIVERGERFLEQLGRGVGRHRAFGFGALLVVPPGTPYPRA